LYLCIWGHREYTRETREGWPLLTVEAKANQGISYERGPVGSLGLSCQFKRSVSYLDFSSRPVQNTSFLTIHYFTSFVPSRPASWAGSRANSPVSLYVSLEYTLLLEVRAQMALASLVAISGPKKVSISRAHPFQWPL
jgi:hypothetical protein